MHAASNTDTEREGLVFSGLRVIDFGSFVASPASTTMLGDLGAEVIKIEPLEGDPYRTLYTAPGHPKGEHNYFWMLTNRNKKSIAIDLKNPASRAAFDKLIGSTDVFVTNMPLHVRDRLGVRYDDLRALNHKLVYASFTAYGEKGPQASKTGYDSTAWWSRSGMMDIIRPGPESAPARPAPAMGDSTSGVSLFAAISAALYRRERTGKGSYVSTSLLANGIWANSVLTQAVLCKSTYQRRPPREQATNALNNIYQSGDGRWFFIALGNEDRQWPWLLDVFGDESLRQDLRFSTSSARHANAGALITILDQLFASQGWSYWSETLDRHNITFSETSTMEEVAHDRQALDSGVLVPVEGTPGVDYTVATPVFFAHMYPRPAGRAPDLGEHTDVLLKELGMTQEEIAHLRSIGALL